MNTIQKVRISAVAVVTLTLSGAPVRADESANTEGAENFTDTPAEISPPAGGSQNVGTEMETISAVLNKLNYADSPLKKLGDSMNFRPKVFEGEDGSSSLGFSWDYSRSVSEYEVSSTDKGPKHIGYAFSLKSEGNVAFDSDSNPYDFLNVEASLAGLRSIGGVKNKEELSYAALGSRFDLLREAATDPDAAERLFALMQTQLTNQIYTDVAADIGYETDQEFDNQQFK